MQNLFIYHILIDRFAGQIKPDRKLNEFLGGNIRGIISKLDYLKELGVDVLWLSPFYETNQYHGYHITNFEKPDSRFGNIQDLKELVDAAHHKSMQIIADFVPNHCSVNHLFFRDALQNSASTYRKWFYFDKHNQYRSFLYFKEIPKINLDYQPAREYMTSVAKYWLSLGLDGFRLDHAIGPSLAFWEYFTKEVKNAYPDTILIGEAWMQGFPKKYFNTINIKNKLLRRWFHVSQKKLQLDYYGLFDSVFDFHFNSMVKNHFASQLKNSDNFKRRIEHYLNSYPANYRPVLFLDNHDMDRFLFFAGNDKSKLKEALEMLFSLHCPVSLYYGTETGLIQPETMYQTKPHADLAVRAPMNWDSADTELIRFVAALAEKYKMFS